MGEALRGRVREETGVTCSVGIAPNRMLAKVPHPVLFGSALCAQQHFHKHQVTLLLHVQDV